MSLEIYAYRSGLHRLRNALESGAARIGFLGGSITDQKTGTRWPEAVIAWFSIQFPKVRLIVENAAIGATGSDLAVFRAARDILSRDCDIVFVEYAVNDDGTPPAQRARTREGLLRQLLAEPRDVVLTYTFMQSHYDDILAGRLPPSVGDFEILANHYRISSVWMGLHALREVEAGLMRWEEWLPDGLHPTHRGSLSYARSVILHLEKELVNNPTADSVLTGPCRPDPIDPLCWERVAILPFDNIARSGPWTERRWGQLNWIDQVLHCTAPGATLSTRFEGRGLVAAFDFGSTSAEFRWRIDGGDWQVSDRERPQWAGDSGWFRPTVLADDLANGTHFFEFETLRSWRAEATGCTTTLVFLGEIL